MLVPVGESVTLRQTVGYAVGVAEETGASAIHFVVPVAWHSAGDVEPAVRREVETLLDRVQVWAREDASGTTPAVETAIIGEEQYMFSPDDYAGVLADYADAHGVERIVVDPEYSPGGNVPLLRAMEVSLVERGYTVEEAPVETPVRRSRLTRPGGAVQFGLLFAVSFLFYQLLGGFAIVTGDTFDLFYELITGTIAAGIVAGSLHRVTMSERPRLRRLGVQLVRLSLYVPYLLYEIVKSNILITFIILHPRLPIEPRLTRVRVAVWGGSPLTTLANSITLTPGTLTVRADGQYLYVHALFPSAREGLFAGTLERAVRFVYYGRAAAAVATPEERGDTELLQRPEEDADAGASVRSGEGSSEETRREGERSEEARTEDERSEEARTGDDRSDDDRTPPGDGGGA